MLVRIIWSLFTLDWFQWHKNMAHYTKQAAAGLEEGGGGFRTFVRRHPNTRHISTFLHLLLLLLLRLKKKKKKKNWLPLISGRF